MLTPRLPVGCLAAAILAWVPASAFVQTVPPGWAVNSSGRGGRLSRAAAASLAPRVRAMHMATAYKLGDKELRGPLVPMDDTVIVKRHKAKEQTTGGLFLPSQAVEKPNSGTVVAAGAGKRHWETGLLYPQQVAPGDNVVFATYGGTNVKYQGEDHVLLRQDDLLFRYSGDELDMATAEVLGDRLLIKVVKDIEPVKPSGVVIAAMAVKGDKPTTGEVVKVGKPRAAPTGKEIPLFAEVGDFIKFRDFAAEYVASQDVKIDGVEYIVIRNADVLAKW